jgi:hypothetical protein
MILLDFCEFRELILKVFEWHLDSCFQIRILNFCWIQKPHSHCQFINFYTNNKVSLSKSYKIDSTNLHCIPKNYTIKFLTIYYNFLPSYTWQHRLSFNGQFKFEESNLVDEWRKLSELEEVETLGLTVDHQNRLIFFYQNFQTAIVKVKLNFIHAFWMSGKH